MAVAGSVEVTKKFTCTCWPQLLRACIHRVLFRTCTNAQIKLHHVCHLPHGLQRLNTAPLRPQRQHHAPGTLIWTMAGALGATRRASWLRTRSSFPADSPLSSTTFTQKASSLVSTRTPSDAPHSQCLTGSSLSCAAPKQVLGDAVGHGDLVALGWALVPCARTDRDK
jgi:hypothetical protein